MAKSVRCLIFLVLLSSCVLPEWDVPPVAYDVKGIMTWVATNIDFVRDIDLYGVSEYFASPMEVYTTRAGDCWGYSIIALYLLHRDADVDALMILGRTTRQTGHAWLRIDGVDWEPQWGVPEIDAVEMDFLTYRQAMSLVGRVPDAR